VSGKTWIAALSALIALVSLVVSIWSSRTSDKSALASQESAKAALESVELQKRQWEESRSAALHFRLTSFSRIHWVRSLDNYVSDGKLMVANTGLSAAMHLSLDPSNDSELYFWAPHADPTEVGPESSTEISFTHGFIPDEPCLVPMVVHYRDGTGEHVVDLVFEVTIEHAEPDTNLIASRKRTVRLVSSTVRPNQ
jgi:hypothetical protein